MISKERREALLKEYDQAANNFRTLTDIRFRLLGLLPVASAFGAIFSFKGDIVGGGAFVLSLFGLIVSIGVISYNARNDQLYDELVKRTAEIERILGLPDGTFANRSDTWLTIRICGCNWKADHRKGVVAIYVASISLWLCGIFAPIVGLVLRTSSMYSSFTFPVPDPLSWIIVIAFILAIEVTCIAARIVKRQKERLDCYMSKYANLAVNRARKLGVAQALKDPAFLNACAELILRNPSVRENNDLDPKISARATFLLSLHPQSLSYYLPTESNELEAAHLVASLTDLSPQWLFDCAIERREKVMPSFLLIQRPQQLTKSTR